MGRAYTESRSNGKIWEFEFIGDFFHNIFNILNIFYLFSNEKMKHCSTCILCLEIILKFERFKQVMTVEINYSDDPKDPLIDADARRYGQLAWLLRAHTLVDVDCWSRVPGQPLPPGMIEAAVRERLQGAIKCTD